jgi:hypothetical protein
VKDGKLQILRIEDKINGGMLPLAGNCFQVAFYWQPFEVLVLE